MNLLKRAVLTVTILALSAQAALAVPLPQPTGGFEITPSRRDVVGVPSAVLAPTNVINRTSSGYQVAVFPAILSQDLSGAFDFAATPRNLNASRLVISSTPGGFALPPGATQQVDLRWNLLPRGRKWITMGVVFQGMPQGQTGPVRVITRLLSVNFLRLPGLHNINGSFTGLYAQQFGPRVLQFTPRVKNIGDRFWAPSGGTLTIRDSTGSVAFSQLWAGRVVIPGAQVDFPVDVHKLLPAGRYTATSTMQFGGHRRSTTTAFTLVGPNQLPTPQITIRGFNASGEIGSATNVTARILSSGTAPASLTLHLFLARAQSVGPRASALATATVSYSRLAPGRRVRLSRPLGKALPKGSYRVLATWTDATGAPHTLEADFTATPAKSWFDSVWGFIKVLFIVLLVIALLIVAGAIFRRSRDRRRRTEAELLAARAQLRMARLHGRAAATEERLSARHDREPFEEEAEAIEPVLEPEPPVIVEPARPREPEAPAVASGSNGSGSGVEERPMTRVPPDPVTSTAADSDWVPPWERAKATQEPDPSADS